MNALTRDPTWIDARRSPLMGVPVQDPTAAVTARSPAPGSVRVCVIDSQRSGSAYPRLHECRLLELVGHVPVLDTRLLPWELVEQVAVVIVGTNANEIPEPRFQSHLLRLTRRARVMLVMAGPVDPVAAAQLGARGLIGREVEPPAIDRVVQAVAADEVAFPRSALTVLFDQRVFGRSILPARPTGTALTQRQHEVAALIADGATDREVALRLRISESTARKHVQNALRRSHAKTRSQLVALLHHEPPAAL